MPAGLVICFSGRMGSGKSSVTQTLSTALGWARAGFGDYVRDCVARAGGNPESREALQDFGQQLVATDPDGFCRDVLNSGKFSPGGNFILDGLRHVDIYTRVSRIVLPSRTVLFHLTLDDAELRKRVEGRSEKASELARAEKHTVEADVASSLPAIANWVIDATPSVPEVAKTILEKLSESDVDAASIAKARAAIE